MQEQIFQDVMIPFLGTDMEGICPVVGDFGKLPFADGGFAVVTCSMSFHHYPDSLYVPAWGLAAGWKVSFKGYGIRRQGLAFAERWRLFSRKDFR